MEAKQMSPGVERKRAERDIRAIGGMVSFLFSAFLSINMYAQQSNFHENYSMNDTLDSAGAFKTDTADSASTMMKSYLAQQRDVYDVLKMLFGLDITSSDTASKEKGKLYVAAIPGVGYSLSTKFAVTIGANAGIYTDNVDSVNLSTFNSDPTYTTNHQLVVPFQSNIWTSGNEYNFLGNWVFYKYPQLTFGLGGHSSANDAEQLDEQVRSIA